MWMIMNKTQNVYFISFIPISTLNTYVYVTKSKLSYSNMTIISRSLLYRKTSILSLTIRYTYSSLRYINLYGRSIIQLTYKNDIYRSYKIITRLKSKTPYCEDRCRFKAFEPRRMHIHLFLVTWK